MPDLQVGDTVTFTATGRIDALDGKGGCLLTIHAVGGIPFLVSQVRRVPPTEEVSLHLERLNLLDKEVRLLLDEPERRKGWSKQLQQTMELFGSEIDWFIRQKVTLKWVQSHYELDPNE